jgi:hypothetical protein
MIKMPQEERQSDSAREGSPSNPKFHTQTQTSAYSLGNLCSLCQNFRPMDIFRRHHPPGGDSYFFLDVSEKGSPQ